MTDTQSDIVISGAGIAGLIAAVALGKTGATVTVIDPQIPSPTDLKDAASDLRSTAYLQLARQLMEDIDLWPDFAPHAVALDALRITDTTGWPPQITESRLFEASDLGAPSFGWNIPNWQARQLLLDHIARQPNTTLRLGTGFGAVLTRTREAIVTLSDQSRIRTRLLIGADGRASPVRAAAGIDVKTTRYGQKALAFCASHPDPHHNISTETYNQGGAFTAVPLPDHNGSPASAIVWMNSGPKTKDLTALPQDAFNAEMTQRAANQLGPMARITDLRSWPVITQTASELTAERIALIAEAAHVLPPIGAQGLNTSLHDIAALYDLINSDPDALGTPGQLDLYAASRSRDIALRARAIDLFNRTCQSGQSPVQAIRSAGLKAVFDIKPLRQTLMRQGLGQRQPIRAVVPRFFSF